MLLVLVCRLESRSLPGGIPAALGKTSRNGATARQRGERGKGARRAREGNKGKRKVGQGREDGQHLALPSLIASLCAPIGDHTAPFVDAPKAREPCKDEYRPHPCAPSRWVFLPAPRGNGNPLRNKGAQPVANLHGRRQGCHARGWGRPGSGTCLADMPSQIGGVLPTWQRVARTTVPAEPLGLQGRRQIPRLGTRPVGAQALASRLQGRLNAQLHHEARGSPSKRRHPRSRRHGRHTTPRSDGPGYFESSGAARPPPRPRLRVLGEIWSNRPSPTTVMRHWGCRASLRRRCFTHKIQHLGCGANLCFWCV